MVLDTDTDVNNYLKPDLYPISNLKSYPHLYPFKNYSDMTIFKFIIFPNQRDMLDTV